MLDHIGSGVADAVIPFAKRYSGTMVRCAVSPGLRCYSFSFSELLSFGSPFRQTKGPMLHLAKLHATPSNQALERTADRRDNLFPMTSTLKLEAQPALVSGRSSCSR